MSYPYKIGVDFSPLTDLEVTGPVTEVVRPKEYTQNEVFILGTQLVPDVAAGIHGLPEALPVAVKNPFKIAIEG